MVGVAMLLDVWQWSGSLLPEQNQPPKHEFSSAGVLHEMFVKTALGVDREDKAGPALHLHDVLRLQRMLHACTPFVYKHKTAAEIRRGSAYC